MKQCLFYGCTNGQFGGGFCRIHQYKRTDKENKAQNKAVEPRSPMRRHKLQTANKQCLKTTKNELLFSFDFNNQGDMFTQIWFERPHVCQLSGRDLNKVSDYRLHWCFAHIIPKGLYPYFKYNKENILLLHPDVHTMVDNFTEDLREKNKDVNFDYWFELQDKMKQQYKQFLLDNML